MVMLPRSLNEAVGRAAELNFTSKSEWARQALRRELANNGLEVPSVASASQMLPDSSTRGGGTKE
jgi:hypothetical protein